MIKISKTPWCKRYKKEVEFCEECHSGCSECDQFVALTKVQLVEEKEKNNQWKDKSSLLGGKI